MTSLKLHSWQRSEILRDALAEKLRGKQATQILFTENLRNCLIPVDFWKRYYSRFSSIIDYILSQPGRIF
jgi:hypothetical protein